MVLSDRDINRCIRKGEIVFTPKLSPEQIGPASVDLTLDGRFWVFKKGYVGRIAVDLKKVDFKSAMREIKSKSLAIPSGSMALGITKEKLCLAPNIVGTLEGRSRYARMGLAVHVTSALVQPGSDNHQVLEIVNFAPFPVTIHEGMRISQILFERLETKTSKPYARFGKVARRQ